MSFFLAKYFKNHVRAEEPVIWQDSKAFILPSHLYLNGQQLNNFIIIIVEVVLELPM
jgi:hypothetical protein